MSVLTDNDFKTISVVSKELDIPQYVLRFWEKQFTQIAPIKRKGGRRFYRAEDVENIKKIKTLLYDKGHTIKGAKRLLKGSKTTLSEKITAPAEKVQNKQVLQSVLNTLVELKKLLD